MELSLLLRIVSLFGLAPTYVLLRSAEAVDSKTEPQKRSYAHCFGTSQFLFVGFANCHLTTERSPPPGMCPYHTLYQASTYSQSQWDCARVQMHLLLGSDEQPRVMIIGASRDYGYMVAQIKTVSWPQDNINSKYHFRKELIDIEGAHTYIGDLLYSEVVTTIFDNRYRLLYVLRNNSFLHSIECVMFFVEAPPGGNVNFVQIGVFGIHRNNDQRTLWTQDPYTRNVHYAERGIDGDSMLIYSLPYDQLMSVLVDGHAGKLERVLLGARSYLSVSKGVAISYSSANDIVKQYVHRLNDTSEVILCEHESARSRLDPAAQLVILFDEDYCKVREGTITLEKCEQEHLMESTVQHNSGSSEQTSKLNFLWFLPVVFILCAVIFLLIVYIVRQQRQDESRSFTKAERPHVQYYPTFISDSSTDF